MIGINFPVECRIIIKNSDKNYKVSFITLMSVSGIIRRVCWVSGLYLGVPQILYKLSRRDVVLMYHSVEITDSGYEYAVTAEGLSQQISILKKYFHIVPLHEILLPKTGARRAALTFDDAFADFHDVAFPVLREKKVHATMFVPTTFIETETTMLDGTPHLSWKQMRRMQDSGLVDIQSHGHSHQHIRTMSIKELRGDIMKSKNIIESHLDTTADLFAYPGGKFLDWQHATILNLGFKAVFTSVKKTIGNSRMVLPRIAITRNCTRAHFLAEVSGMWEVVYGKSRR